MSIISILFLNSYLINQISNFQSATNKEYASILMNAWVLFGICIMSLLILFLNLKKFIKIEKQIVSRKGITDKQIQTKNRFLSNMSHEIRSPLNCIMGFTDIIDGIETDPEKKKYLQAIKTSSDHLLNTVNDILDF